MNHVPVLQEEFISAFKDVPLNVYVDGTVGLGGHLSLLLESGNVPKQIFAFDKDINHLNKAKDNLAKFTSSLDNKITFINSGFETLQDSLREYGVEKVDGILLDIGIASPHVDVAERGFSFRFDAPLDMRFDESEELTAYDVVNFYREEELADVIYEYGEERRSRKIAKLIVTARKKEKIKTTFELIEVLSPLMSGKFGKTHFATRIFQALRIEVNNELGVLKEVLPQALDMLNPGGRLAVMSFHSLEDRIVKHYFKNEKDKLVKILTKRPITPSEEEIKVNPRSRSTKLRIIEKI